MTHIQRFSEVPQTEHVDFSDCCWQYLHTYKTIHIYIFVKQDNVFTGACECIQACQFATFEQRDGSMYRTWRVCPLGDARAMERMIAHCCQNPTYVLIKSLCRWTLNQHKLENMKNPDGKCQGSSHTSSHTHTCQIVGSVLLDQTTVIIKSQKLSCWF